MMIEFQEVSLSTGSSKLFDAFSFRMADPGVYVILGGNGSGKSLISNMLSGKCKPNSGKILVEGSSMYGSGSNRFAEPVFHAKAEQSFRFDETLHDYICSEMQIVGGEMAQVEQCMTHLEDEILGKMNCLMGDLPHGLVLLTQMILAAYVPCRLVILDGHLTFMDSIRCLAAANAATNSPFAHEKFFVFSSGRLVQRLPGISNYFLLEGNLPISIKPLEYISDERVKTRGDILSIHFCEEWDGVKNVVSGNNFQLVSRIDNGIRIKLTGTLDGLLQELSAVSLTPWRIEWE